MKELERKALRTQIIFIFDSLVDRKDRQLGLGPFRNYREEKSGAYLKHISNLTMLDLATL
jgi:hypothetical protein